MPTLTDGTLLDGRYKIVRQLDEGGMGAVFVAEHVFLRKQMALKMLKAELAKDAAAVARFEREARAASAIDHPNIVRVTDFGRTADGEVYLVMELLSGRPLSAELVRLGRVPAERTRAIMIEVLQALEAAHAAAIVHRDLKPENVFLVKTPGGELVKLVDFGIAQVKLSGEARLTSTGAVMGTPLYMAPEQVRGQRDLDQRVDLHAVGVMLYEMLAGRTPYQGDQFGPIAHQILTGRPPSLREVAPDVDPLLAAIVMKAFAPDREARFRTAGELREALERWQPGQMEASAFSAPRASMLTDLGRPLDRPTADGRAHAPTVNAPTRLPGDANVNVNVNANANANANANVRESVFSPAVGSDVALELDRPTTAPPPSEPEAPPKSRAPMRIAAAGALVVALGAGAWVATGKLRGPAVKAPSHYQVINLPAGARVFVDSVPASTTFDVDPTKPHTFRIELHGQVYRPLVLDEHADPIIDGAVDRKR